MQMATDCGCHNKDISVNYGFQEQTRGIWSPAEGAVSCSACDDDGSGGGGSFGINNRFAFIC